MARYFMKAGPAYGITDPLELMVQELFQDKDSRLLNSDEEKENLVRTARIAVENIFSGEGRRIVVDIVEDDKTGATIIHVPAIASLTLIKIKE